MCAGCARSDDAWDRSRLLDDPLIRLVMQSDGVTEQAMGALLDQLCQTLQARRLAAHLTKGSATVQPSR